MAVENHLHPLETVPPHPRARFFLNKGGKQGACLGLSLGPALSQPFCFPSVLSSVLSCLFSGTVSEKLFQSLENAQKIFPIIGKTGRNFPTIGKKFSNHWKTRLPPPSQRIVQNPGRKREWPGQALEGGGAAPMHRKSIQSSITNQNTGTQQIQSTHLP